MAPGLSTQRPKLQAHKEKPPGFPARYCRIFYLTPILVLVIRSLVAETPKPLQRELVAVVAVV